MKKASGVLEKQAYSAPFCTMQLADFRAEAIKIERKNELRCANYEILTSLNEKILKLFGYTNNDIKMFRQKEVI